MTPTQHPEPAEVVGLEGVLAAHEWQGNPTLCVCGWDSPTIAIGMSTGRSHRIHVAEQVRAWLGDVEAERDTARREADDPRALLGKVEAVLREWDHDPDINHVGAIHSAIIRDLRAALANPDTKDTP